MFAVLALVFFAIHRLITNGKIRDRRAHPGGGRSGEQPPGNVKGVGSAQAPASDSSNRPFAAERGAVTADSLSKAVGRR